MARIRTIKPEFNASESVARMSDSAQLFMIKLLVEVDDQGRIEWMPRKILGTLYPHNEEIGNDELEARVSELESHDIFRRYEIEGKQYGHFVNWEKHQVVKNPSKPRCPEPPSEKATKKRTDEPCATKTAKSAPKKEEKPEPAETLPQNSPEIEPKSDNPAEALTQSYGDFTEDLRRPSALEIGNRKWEVGNRKEEIGNRKLEVVARDAPDPGESLPGKPDNDDDLASEVDEILRQLPGIARSKPAARLVAELMSDHPEIPRSDWPKIARGCRDWCRAWPSMGENATHAWVSSSVLRDYIAQKIEPGRKVDKHKKGGVSDGGAAWSEAMFGEADGGAAWSEALK